MKKQLFGAIFLIAATFSGITMIPGVVSAHEDGKVLGCVTLTKNLTIGSKDPSVLKLQEFLHVYGYMADEPTGYFGKITFASLQKYQRHANIPAIGIAGPMTRAAIGKVTCNTPTVATAPIVPVTPPVITPTQPQSQAAAVVVATTPSAPTIKLPYRSEDFKNWKGTWGGVTVNPAGYLELKALYNSTGAEAELPGGSEWTNYTYNASVVVWNGDVTLIARYTDDKNFVSCSFKDNGATARQTVNGTTKTIASGTFEGLSATQDFPLNTSFSITVKDSVVICSAIAGQAVTGSMDASLKKGGIGIQGWFKNLGVMEMQVRSVFIDYTI